jgi:serine/threonine-protein kinase HipA
VQAAPAHDLPSSYPYGDVTLALTVAGKSREDVGRDDLMALAATWGLPTRAATKVLDEVVSRTDRWLPRLGESGFPERTVVKWTRGVEYRRKRLA